MSEAHTYNIDASNCPAVLQNVMKLYGTNHASSVDLVNWMATPINAEAAKMMQQAYVHVTSIAANLGAAENDSARSHQIVKPSEGYIYV